MASCVWTTASWAETVESHEGTRASFQVYALSTDSGWLKTVESLTGAALMVHGFDCTEGYQRCLEELPPPQEKALVLVDAAGIADVAGVVRKLRERGWPYIVVVSAAPSWKDARDVLQAGAYDYIAKSNVPANIRRIVEKYRGEIESAVGKDDSYSDPNEGILESTLGGRS